MNRTNGTIAAPPASVDWASQNLIMGSYKGNERQRLVLNRLLDDFEGKLTSSKWANLAKTSQDTASRDIEDLISKGILVRGPAVDAAQVMILSPLILQRRNDIHQN